MRSHGVCSCVVETLDNPTLKTVVMLGLPASALIGWLTSWSMLSRLTPPQALHVEALHQRTTIPSPPPRHHQRRVVPGPRGDGERAAHRYDVAPPAYDVAPPAPRQLQRAPLPNAAADDEQGTTCLSRQVQPDTATGREQLLVLGLISAPSNDARRAWVRRATSPFAASHSVVIRFVLGARGLSASRCALVSREAAHHGDLDLLDALDDEAWWTAKGSRGRGVGCIDKTFRWLSHALRRYPHARFLGKGDDDEFINVPNLAALLGAMEAAPLPARHVGSLSMYAGWVQYSSYSPANFKMCGWSPSARAAVRLASSPSCRKGAPARMAAGSASGGHSAVARAIPGPFPFVAGALELFSSDLARQVFASPATQEFVARARGVAAGGAAAPEVRWMNNHEDPTVGYVVQEAAKQQRLNVTLVALNGFGFESPLVVDATDTRLEIGARLPALVAVHRVLQDAEELAQLEARGRGLEAREARGRGLEARGREARGREGRGALEQKEGLEGLANRRHENRAHKPPHDDDDDDDYQHSPSRSEAQDAEDVRRLVAINRRLAPQLAVVLKTSEEAARRRQNQSVAPVRNHQYMLACQTPSTALIDRHRMVWREVAHIRTLPCCAEWTVCWLL